MMIYEAPLPQRLPNECLLIVVEYLVNDLRTLHSLLTVNRFFFHAALPWMLNSPFKTWEMHHVRPTFRTDREKLIVLLLSSALRHYQQKTLETNDSTAVGNDSQYTSPSGKVRSPVEELLREYGLQLHGEDQLRGHHPLLLECLEESRNSSLSSLPKMSADYHAFVGETIDQTRPYIKFEQFIRLRRLPYTMEDRFGDLGVDDMVLDVEDDDEDREEDLIHDLEQQREEDYRIEIYANLQRLLFQCNAENITKIHWDMSKDSDFLRPLATRMGSLRDLSVQWGSIVSDEGVQAVLQFIQDHRATFPDRALHLWMDTNWIDQILKHSLAAMDPSIILAKMKQYVRPKMLLYAAQGRATKMDGSLVVDFYDQVSQGNNFFHLNQLESFVDDDEYRQQFAGTVFLQNQGPREDFLRACSNLRHLQETISHRDMFAWAALAKRERQALEAKAAETHLTAKDSYLYLRHVLPSAILPKLTSLTLSSQTSYHDMIAAANDALEAFSDSLQTFEIQACMKLTQETMETEYWIQSRTDPRCTRILLLNPLPHLTSLQIDCALFPGLDEMGPLTVQQCPVLESLWIRMGVDESIERDVLPFSEVIAEDRDRPPQWTLFSRWDLPRLMDLRLTGTAALRFDFDSLATMTRLESLDMDCPRDHALKNYLGQIPRLSNHLGMSTLTPRWTSRQWNLPRLQKLTMQGPSALVFEFGWLEKMPKLDHLYLEIGDKYSVQGVPEDHASSLNVVSGLGGRRFEAAKKASRLEKVRLMGPWIKTAEDIQALSHYIQGPKLRTLFLQRAPLSSDVDSEYTVRQSPNEDEEETRVVVASAVSLEFGLMQELLNQIKSACPELRKVNTDISLTRKEIHDLRMQILSDDNSGQRERCSVFFANGDALILGPRLEN